MTRKSSIEEIRARFDRDVERFANLDTGQNATIDAPLVMDLVTEAAAACCPTAQKLLDIGCGAGNYALKMLERIPTLQVTLLDISQTMLDRAVARLAQAGAMDARAIQMDIRDYTAPDGEFDIVLAAAVFHHLRDDQEWESVFSKIYRLLRPGGCLFVSDLIYHSIPEVQNTLWRRYEDYLVGLSGPDYRDEVVAYIEKEDTPRPVFWQMELLKRVGFSEVDILHKNSCYAAYGAVKALDERPSTD